MLWWTYSCVCEQSHWMFCYNCYVATCDCFCIWMCMCEYGPRKIWLHICFGKNAFSTPQLSPVNWRSQRTEYKILCCVETNFWSGQSRIISSYHGYLPHLGRVLSNPMPYIKEFDIIVAISWWNICLKFDNNILAAPSIVISSALKLGILLTSLLCSILKIRPNRPNRRCLRDQT